MIRHNPLRRNRFLRIKKIVKRRREAAFLAKQHQAEQQAQTEKVQALEERVKSLEGDVAVLMAMSVVTRLVEEAEKRSTLLGKLKAWFKR